VPTATITVLDEPTGSEVATQSFTEDALTKHAQRFADDLRLTGVPRSFVLTPTAAGVTGGTTAGTNIASIRHLTANPDAYITRVDMGLYIAGTASIVPAQMKRATGISGGTLTAFVESGNEVDTDATVPLLEFRRGAVTATEAANPLWTFIFFMTGTGAGRAAASRSWVAQDRSEWIRLTGDEGLVFDYPIASSAIATFFVSVTWREA